MNLKLNARWVRARMQSHSSPSPPLKAHDLFTESTDDDPFAQLDGADSSHAVNLYMEPDPATRPTLIPLPEDHPNDFAYDTSHDQIVPPSFAPPLPQDIPLPKEDPQSPEPEPQGQAKPTPDYSLLLAEFSDIDILPPVEEEQRTQGDVRLPHARHLSGAEEQDITVDPHDQFPAAAALFGTSADEDQTFDPFLPLVGVPDATSTPPIVSPVPELSIEQDQDDDPFHALAQAGASSAIAETGETSLLSDFSDASNWLEDTSIDMSLDQGPQQDIGPETKDHSYDDVQPVEVDIPQGWYDDHGEWHWYTEEEKAAVRQVMLTPDTSVLEQSHGSPDVGVTNGYGQNIISPALNTGAFSPGLSARPTFERGNSENLARRTPQPEQPAVLNSITYDPYAPPPQSQADAGPSTSYHPYQPYQPAVYDPAPPSTLNGSSVGDSKYSASLSKYDPYAPPTSSMPQRSVSNSGPTSVNKPPGPPAPKPQLQRMTSNAYDPPLRQNKPIARSVSAAPLVPIGFSMAQAPPVPPLPNMNPPVAAPRPPPSGPPRRGKTPVAPVFDPPPKMPAEQRAPLINGQAGHEFYHPEISSGPPARASSSTSTHADNIRPGSFNSFDPPIRPFSTAHHQPHHYPAPQVYTPPTLAISPPPGEAAARPASRGPPRRSSPMYDAPPLPRPASVNPPSNPPQNSNYDQPHRPAPPPFPGDTYDSRPQPLTQSRLWDEDQPGHDLSDAYSHHTLSPPVPQSAYQLEPPRPTLPVNPSDIEGNFDQSSSLGLQHHAPHEPPQPVPQSRPYQPYLPTSDTTSSYAPQPSRHSPAPSYGQPQSYEPSPYSVYAPSMTSPTQSQPRPISDYSTSPSLAFSPVQQRTSFDEAYVPQQVLEQRPVSEDPLGRCSLIARNIPFAVFGFGGTVITAFPATADGEAPGLGHNRTMSYGYASGRGKVWLRNITELVPPSVLKISETPFPGPLLLDPAVPKGVAGEKKKREAIVGYLEARTEEIERGLPYLMSSASRARRKQEGKLVLVKLLAAMMLGEGRLLGSPKVEDAVRNALRPPAETPNTYPSTTSNHITANGFSTAQGAPVTSSQLSDISNLLGSGDKRGAVAYAVEAGLWAHALVISSSVDPELWSETVSRFSASELGDKGPSVSGLKASYALFSGATSHTDDPANDQWREVISAVLFNGKAADLLCLDELAQRLVAAKLPEAAQVCFLLSPSSPFSDPTPAAADKPILLLQQKDEDSTIIAEVAEYARSLIPLPKGQESPFAGLPGLLPEKLHRAWIAAELGEIDIATRYCNAIAAASKPIKAGPSLLPPSLLASLEDLLERLTGTPSVDPPTAIGSRRAPKPGLDKLGSWIGGRLTTFIAGEEGGPPPKPDPTQTGPVGPFSHFSSISPNPSMPTTRTTSSSDSGRSGHLGIPNIDPGQNYDPTSRSYGSSSSLNTYGDWSAYNNHLDDDATPHAEIPPDGPVELLTPMAALSLNSSNTPSFTSTYQPAQHDEEEVEDDLGFGNTSLSRARTPKPESSRDTNTSNQSTQSTTDKPVTPTPPTDSPKPEQKTGWLRGWFGKKDDSPGPVKANLGEESSMVFDPELKRWVVKGSKGEKTPPPQLAPPPRAQTASPSKLGRPNHHQSQAPTVRPMSVVPGISGPPKSSSMTSLTGTEIRKSRSSLNESVTAGDVDRITFSVDPEGESGGQGGKEEGEERVQGGKEGDGRGNVNSGNGPPRLTPTPMTSLGIGPPSRPGTASIDDLLSRPPTRPGSKVKKPRNKYVDVFQGQG
ncbi:hypothetical protein TREMEDRAFT_61295 [Tremella mesenterica DSM 1558]|uniref:uncharacterized protein n=1 Tax=Tremella mesenterica (strain ATCC 24925 / CBS 8224 / DSM 1558 / NBRC 9311 / NRRL Y-6157 / RJB 2259-6 / UBC 559-6) TaxID=578456 RepID=UPI0003F49580|nr:uncharacterized protein TREMEDRAFT_61295 [Tremella mesenterica DSM 1558]EIW70788.1 hypothetical protein TREMEDRAFT_61295 [Tremella mesenterica DSM 1558]